MGRDAWELVKHSKWFYVKTYRLVTRLLVISFLVNIILGVAVGYVYLSLPEPDFYSSNGTTPPVMLVAMDEPNHSSLPLLAEDPEVETQVKLIPQ